MPSMRIPQQSFRVRAESRPIRPKLCCKFSRYSLQCLAKARRGEEPEANARRHRQHALVQSLLATAAACMLSSCPASWAEVQSVAPKDVTSLARQLPKQKVNKGKVWLIFLAGATGLFGAAVAIERNSALFPAIAKANQAMAATRAAQKTKEEKQEAIEVEQDAERSSEAAVLQGLADARSKVQAESMSREVSSSGDSADGGSISSNGSGRLQEKPSESPSKTEESEGRENVVKQSSSGS